MYKIYFAKDKKMNFAKQFGTVSERKPTNWDG